MYTVLFLERERVMLDTGPVFRGKRVVFAKSYEDTPKQREEMRQDIREWEDEDPAAHETRVAREE